MLGPQGVLIQLPIQENLQEISPCIPTNPWPPTSQVWVFHGSRKLNPNPNPLTLPATRAGRNQGTVYTGSRLSHNNSIGKNGKFLPMGYEESTPMSTQWYVGTVAEDWREKKAVWEGYRKFKGGRNRATQRERYGCPRGCLVR